MFGPKRECHTRVRKLHGEELHPLFPLPDMTMVIKLRRMGWMGHVASMGDIRNEYNILVGKPEGKRSLERPRSRWDSIRIDLEM
jgi:hypothetical protein